MDTAAANSPLESSETEEECYPNPSQMTITRSTVGETLYRWLNSGIRAIETVFVKKREGLNGHGNSITIQLLRKGRG